MSTTLYRVVKGDTLFGIARRFGMTIAEIKTLNSLQSDALSIGQILKVKGTNPVFVPPTPTPNPTPPPPVSVGSEIKVEKVDRADFSEFFITMPHPQGGTMRARLHNKISPTYRVYPIGITWSGLSKPTFPYDTIQSMGLNDLQTRALQFVSQNEGNFDAINSYDRGIFSYGFIQFVGADEHGASLNKLLQSMKNNAPTLFAKYFQKVGIDVRSNVVTVAGLSGSQAWLYIQRNYTLYAPFIQSAYEPLLVKEQLRCAADLYVRVALNMKVSLWVNGINILVPNISQILRSEAAVTMLIDLCVNQGQGGLNRLLQSSIAAVAQRNRLLTLSALATIDERELLTHIVSSPNDARVITRTQKILDSGLSMAK